MEQPPAYFTAFTKELRSDFLGQIAQLVKHVTFLKQQQIRDRALIDALLRRCTMVDDCEVVVYGLPHGFSPSYGAAAERLFSALSLPPALASICSYRDWSPPLRNFSSSSSTQISSYTAFVIRLPSPQFRHRLLQVSNKLKSQTAHQIFGHGGHHAVFIKPIWPKPVYELFKIALQASKSANYSRPVVHNLVVCLRKSANSPLIPIFTETDIDNHFSSLSNSNLASNPSDSHPNQIASSIRHSAADSYPTNSNHSPQHKEKLQPIALPITSTSNLTPLYSPSICNIEQKSPTHNLHHSINHKKHPHKSKLQYITN